MNEKQVVVIFRVVGILTSFFAMCWLVVTIASLVGVNATMNDYGAKVTGPLANAGGWYIAGIICVSASGSALFAAAPVLARFATKD